MTTEEKSPVLDKLIEVAMDASVGRHLEEGESIPWDVDGFDFGAAVEAVLEHLGLDHDILERGGVAICVSREGAKSFLSDSAGWGAMGLQEVDDALWEALGRPDRSELRPEPPPERLLDLIEEDRTAWNYWATCERCGSEMGVNMLGMGKCPSCGCDRNPMKSS